VPSTRVILVKGRNVSQSHSGFSVKPPKTLRHPKSLLSPSVIMILDLLEVSSSLPEGTELTIQARSSYHCRLPPRSILMILLSTTYVTGRDLMIDVKRFTMLVRNATKSSLRLLASWTRSCLKLLLLEMVSFLGTFLP